MGGPHKLGRISCLRAFAAGAAVAALAVGVSACGGGSSDKEAGGEYDVAVVHAEFPAKQHLGQTSMLKIAVENNGDKKVPALVITIGIKGKQGETSPLPFGIRDAQPELAQPDRPVWVLAEGYPHLAGASESAGASSSSAKTFDFGPLEPGKTVEAEWKLSAVKAGNWTLAYEVSAGLGGKAKSETKGGAEPGGTIMAEISNRKTEVEVTDSGEIVEIGGAKGDKGTEESSPSEPKGPSAGK